MQVGVDDLYPADKIDLHSIILPVPKVVHRIVEEHDIHKRMIVVGDVHGCLDELKDLLVAARYDPSDTSVLLLGDLVNKGYYSAEVVQYARSIGALCIRGNHEDYALKFALGLVPQRTPDHLSYINQLSGEDIEWLKELPYTICIPSWKTAFVHAGLVPGRSMQLQTLDNMVTMRNVVEDIVTGSVSGTAKGEQGCAWAGAWDGRLGDADGVTVFFGHDAKRGLQMQPHAVGLDTGCAYGKKLSGMVLPGRELVQVAARQVYQAIKDKD